MDHDDLMVFDKLEALSKDLKMSYMKEIAELRKENAELKRSKSMNEHETEKKIVAIFRNTADKVGFMRADLAWYEAGLNDDSTEPDKLERAIEVAHKLLGEVK